MKCCILLVLGLIAGECCAQDDTLSADFDQELWGNGWVAGDYHQHDLQLSERVGLSLDWQGTGIAGMSLSYTPHFGQQIVSSGLPAEEPLTFRVTLRGWELFEANREEGGDFFSFDRIRDREIRKQLVMISVSKRF